MPVRANRPFIPLTVNTARPVTSFLQGRESERTNELLEFAVQGRKQGIEQGDVELQRMQGLLSDEENAREFKSVAMGAFDLKPFLDRGDLEGAEQFLLKRRGEIPGGNMNGTEDTDQALALIAMAKQGDLESFQKLAGQVEDMVLKGQQFGALPVEQQAPDFTLGQGQTRFGPGGNEIASVDPRQATPLVNVDARTGQKETADQITMRKAAESRGTESVNFRTSIREAAQSARAQINQVQRFRQFSTNTETGFFEPTINNLRAIGKGLGIDIDEQALASGEGIQALAVPFTLQIAQQTKGPISDKEMALFASAVPGLSRSPLGNEFILEGMEKIAQRQIDIDRLASEYVRENGLLDVGFDAFLSDWESANPLFDEGEKSLLEGALGGSGPVETATGGTVDLGNGITMQVINE